LEKYLAASAFAVAAAARQVRRRKAIANRLPNRRHVLFFAPNFFAS
jgi:hypothetical protein